MTYKKLLLAGSLVVTSALANAQYNELDAVTVTASVKPANISATGRNLVVINGDQISKLPVNSLDELLRYLPGVEMQSRGPMGAQSDIVMRGGTFQQVLVIIDGIRINDPNTGHFNSYIPVAPGEIDRIEVLKGASSAIYGSEAVGGVINIITKTFAARQGQTAKQLTAQVAGGEYGLFNAQVGGFYQKDKSALGAALVTNNATGQMLRGIRGYFHNTTASLSYRYFLSKTWNLSLRSAYDNRDFAAQNFYTTFKSDTATEKVTTYWNQLQLSHSKNNHNFKLDVGYKDVNDRFVYNTVSTANENKSKLLQALAQYNTQISKDAVLIVGSQFLSKQIASNDRGNHTLNQAGFFVQLNDRLAPTLRVTPALRVEYSQRSGWELVPQINVSYGLPNTQIRLSAGRTIRDADFTERFNNYNKPLVTSGRIGNPDLQQERSNSYEAGVDYFGIKGLKVSGTFFAKYYSRLVDYVTTPYADMPRKDNLLPNGTYALAKNLNDVTTIGGEVDVQYSHKIATNQQLTASVGISKIKSRTNDQEPSFYISSHAGFLTNFSVQYAVKWLNVAINGLYKERTPSQATAINASISDNYFVMNAMVQANVYKNKLGVYVQLDNVFNRQYSDLLGSAMPARWLMGGVKMRL